jgi:hypothetical protein
VRHGHELGAKRRGDELRRRVLILGLALNQASHFGSVVGIERLVDFVKEVKGRGVAALDGEYERQRHYGLLSAAQPLQRHHLALLPLPSLLAQGSYSAWPQLPPPSRRPMNT